MSVPDWIGTVLAALGHHIRALEDEVSKLRYENQSHQAFRQFDRDQITQLKDEIEGKLEGSITEQLALDNNALIDQCRHWVSWAGQAKTFRRDVMNLLHTCFFDHTVDRRAVAEFVTGVRDGAYDIIPMPGVYHAAAPHRHRFAENLRRRA